MAHWFHRNPLKATNKTNFDLKQVSSTTAARQICSDLERTRNKLLDIITDPNIDTKILQEAAVHYISLLHGFLEGYDESSRDSKVRNIVKFRWTNTLGGSKPVEQFDAYFEYFSMLFDIALWYTKHAAKLAGAKEDPNVDEAKDVHKCLRIASGIFTFCKEEVRPKLMDQGAKTDDTDTRVLDAYIQQCTGEAQEITLARAIELKHAAGLRSALAFETAKLFENSHLALKSIDDPIVEKWSKYMQLKFEFYMSYAYSFNGEELLAQDKCGEAIASLRQSVKHYENSEVICKEYTSAKGAGSTVKPGEHLFFRKIGPIVTRTLEKCERENGFIYHQKIPSEIPELQLKATYGLAAPEKFEAPPAHSSWNKNTYDGFDLTKHLVADPNEKNKKKDKEEEGDIAPVKEADIVHTNKDPTTFSGCVLS